MKFFIILFGLLVYSFGGGYTAYTENLPPYNFEKNGKAVGYSVDSLKNIMKKRGLLLSDDDIKVTPWKRAIATVKNKKNTILFSTARVQYREDDYKWVGPIDTMLVGVVAKKSNKIKISNIDDFQNYKVGTLLDSMAETSLLRLGMNSKNMDRFIEIKSQLKKLVNDRIDMVAFGVPAIYYLLNEMNIDISKYEVVYKIKKVNLYYAFNKQTDSKLIQELNEILLSHNF